MQEQTGAIAVFETEHDAKRAGHTIPLTTREAERLRHVPRQKRVDSHDKWLAHRAGRKVRRKAQKAARRNNRRNRP